MLELERYMACAQEAAQAVLNDSGRPQDPMLRQQVRHYLPYQQAQDAAVSTFDSSLHGKTVHAKNVLLRARKPRTNGGR